MKNIRSLTRCLSVNMLGNSIIMLLGIWLISSCSRKENLDLANEGTKLTIQVAGVIGTDLITMNKASASKSSSSTSSAGLASGFNADIHSEQIPISSIEASRSNTTISTKASSNRATTQNMQSGFKYRILVYNKSTGQLWRTVQAVAGTPLSIDVTKGNSYAWYAYSYNDAEDLPEPTNLSDPAIETNISKDLLYAKGEITIAQTAANQQDNYPINIVFNHRVAQVYVKVDASILADYANINSIKVSFDKDTYLKKGVFNVKNDQISQSEAVSTSTIFSALEADNIYEATYYTVDLTAVSTYKIVLDDLNVTFKDVDVSIANRNLATYNGAANKPSFTYNYSSPQAGQRLAGIANLWYTLASKRILHISNNTTFGYALEQGPSWNFLNALENFGNLPNSLVKMAPWASGQGAWIGGSTSDDKSQNWIYYGANSTVDTQIANRLGASNTTNRPDIVILGYDVLYLRPAVVTALLNYMNDKGIVILTMQDNVGPENISFFNQLFGVNNIQLSLRGPAGSMYPLIGNDPNDIILNGRIGDARGKLWGEDAGTTLGIINAPTSQITIYSKGQPINDATTYADRVTMFKHNTKNFFFIGDGGFVSYNGGTSAVICPFNYDPVTKRPLPKPFGYAGNGYAEKSQNAYNSIVMGNIMLWTARTAEFDGLKPWKYAAAPTP
ncbi:hypothetical protein [Sphingobacterium siyangense]|uniref:hypothetical protein n=1 Tax=Sphingobacterium siyangense TaxID=459529 RepID=UPI0028AA4995|nr:hypothetical protein [Sphingobacterium siyangense]